MEFNRTDSELWQHVTWMRTAEETLTGSPDCFMKKCEQSTPGNSTGSINPVLVRFAWWDFYLLSLLPLPPGKSSSFERRHLCDGVTQTVGRKRCLALSRGLVFVRSRTNRGVKHNSEVLVELFMFPLSISVIYGLHLREQEDYAMPKTALCTTDLDVVLRIKVRSRWSFPTSCPFKHQFEAAGTFRISG